MRRNRPARAERRRRESEPRWKQSRTS
jgi:hypothetical protein